MLKVSQEISRRRALQISQQNLGRNLGLSSLDPSNLSSYNYGPAALDDSMSNFDHDHLDHNSEINQINYPRVNINSGNQNRMQNIQN